MTIYSVINLPPYNPHALLTIVHILAVLANVEVFSMVSSAQLDPVSILLGLLSLTISATQPESVV